MTSNIAGIILMLLGIAPAYWGAREIVNHEHLTLVAACSTAGLGVCLMLIGLAHFRAPHKAYLLSIAVLLFLNLQAYSDAILVYNRIVWWQHGALLAASVLILLISYRGYASARLKT